MSEKIISSKYGSENSEAALQFEKINDQILSSSPILSAQDVQVEFTLRGQKLKAIRGCSLDLYEGETLAIVGESGSGKSVFTKLFVGMLDKNGQITNGSIMYDGLDLTKLKTEREWQKIRGKKIAMVTQDPMTSLNPLKKVGLQIREAVELHQGLRGKAAKEETIRLLASVGIPNPEVRYGQYPHEFSGGMRQRAVIAIAVACKPQILICDEPTTALDVTIQAQILDLLRGLKDKINSSIMLITHDLGVIAEMADYIVVMYAGRIVEKGTAEEIFYHPSHPYTIGLMESKPVVGKEVKELYSIPGKVPNPVDMPNYCYFRDRCERRIPCCDGEYPCEISLSETHKVVCYRYDPKYQTQVESQSEEGGNRW